MRKRAITVMLALTGVLASPLAVSAKTSFVGEFQDWGVYQNTQLPGNKCYVLTAPTSFHPAGVRHGDNFVIISKTNGQFSPQLVMGYQLKPNSNVTITIDGKNYPFFTEGNRAWAQNIADEANILNAMQRGRAMNVQATSSRGTNTRYSFSLMGLSASLKRMDQC